MQRASASVTTCQPSVPMACVPLAGSRSSVAQKHHFHPICSRRKCGAPAVRRIATIVRATMAGRASGVPSLTCERSALVNREVVLFLFQLEMDAQLQRALTYENFDTAQEVRQRRQQVDQALRELQEAKGYGCGARGAALSSKFDHAPMALSIRARMSAAVREERYADAARLRDELSKIEEQAAAAELPCPVSEPRYTLGQMVVHNGKGYRGVVCGWDLACCESADWQAKAGVDALSGGADQVFYHVLVDSADWPQDADEAPVAYVAEELLDSASLADFGSPEPLVDSSFDHPYAYLMFLGSDGHGNMIPCRQLREKYCIQRQDRYGPGQEEEWEDVDGEDGGSNGGGGGQGGPDGDQGGVVAEEGSAQEDNRVWGKTKIPGIDMSSLDD